MPYDRLRRRAGGTGLNENRGDSRGTGSSRVARFPKREFLCGSYEPLVVVTADETYNGVPLETSETHMLLATGAEEQVRVTRSRIEEVRPGTVSVMPSGLDEQMTEQELADLLAFLKATRWGPG